MRGSWSAFRQGDLRRVLHTGGASLTSQLMFALGGIIAAHALGPGGRGTVVGILAWLGLIPSIALVGLDAAIAVTVAQDPRKALRTALGNGLVYCTVVGVVSAVAMMIVVPRIVGHLGPDGDTIATWAMAAVPFAMLSNLLLSVNLSLARYRLFNVCRIVTPLVPLLVAAGCAIAGVLTPAIMVAGTIAGILAGLLLMCWRLPWRTIAVSLKELLAELRFGAKVSVGAWLGAANLRLDLLVMSAFVAAAQLGYYSVANNVMIPVTTIPFAAATLLTPAIARMNRSEGGVVVPTGEQVARIRAQAKRYSLIAVAGGLLLAAIAPVGIPLVFGSSFSPAIVLVWILIPGFCARVYAELVNSGTRGLRQAWVGNVIEGSGLVVTVVLLPLLLPALEAKGAAIASTVAYGVTAIAAVLALRRLNPQRNVGRQSDVPPSSGSIATKTRRVEQSSS
jgi:O-antigen/teichoic acid export membrane protein